MDPPVVIPQYVHFNYGLGTWRLIDGLADNFVEALKSAIWHGPTDDLVRRVFDCMLVEDDPRKRAVAFHQIHASTQHMRQQRIIETDDPKKGRLIALCTATSGWNFEVAAINTNVRNAFLL